MRGFTVFTSALNFLVLTLGVSGDLMRRIEAGSVAKVDPKADFGLVRAHRRDQHRRRKSVFGRNLIVVTRIEGRFEGQELSADQLHRLPRAFEPSRRNRAHGRPRGHLCASCHDAQHYLSCCVWLIDENGGIPVAQPRSPVNLIRAMPQCTFGDKFELPKHGKSEQK